MSPDSTGLRAMYVNCTLTRSPGRSHTQGVIDRSVAIMEANGVAVDQIRAVDHDIATGVRPDMTEHGWATDEWPALLTRVLAADILVVDAYYGRVAGCLLTNRNTPFMTYNLIHLAAMIRRAGGIPAHGDQRSAWDAGTHPDHTNPEYP